MNLKPVTCFALLDQYAYHLSVSCGIPTFILVARRIWGKRVKVPLFSRLGSDSASALSCF